MLLWPSSHNMIFLLLQPGFSVSPKSSKVLKVKVIFFNLFLRSLFDIISAFFVVFLFSLNTVKAFFVSLISVQIEKTPRGYRG